MRDALQPTLALFGGLKRPFFQAQLCERSTSCNSQLSIIVLAVQRSHRLGMLQHLVNLHQSHGIGVDRTSAQLALLGFCKVHHP